MKAYDKMKLWLLAFLTSNLTWRLLYVVVYSQQLSFRRGCLSQRTGLDALEERKILCPCQGWSPNPVCKFWRRGKCFASKLNCTMVWDNSVGIATRYGLDGTGIESHWGRDFPHPSRLALGPTQSPIQWVAGFSWG